jgi:hypothetical protein
MAGVLSFGPGDDLILYPREWPVLDLTYAR